MGDQLDIEIDLTDALDDATIQSLFDAFSDDDWAVVDSIIDGIPSEAYEAAEAKAGGADRNRGGAEKLRRYWTVGEGAAKIRWGSPGDWTRCVEQLSKYLGPRAKGYCTLRHKEMNGYYPGDKRNLKASQIEGDLDSKHYPMQEGTKAASDGAPMFEHKTVGVSGLKVLSQEEGIVESFISITGIVDEVKDRIIPGAYAKTLATRIPKGVWSHDWDTPVSKTLDVKELMPGDPLLPKTMPNGQPWPSDAGALMVKTQFNLETQRGREAYSDVVFFGDQQEWSIGYNVPTGGARIDQKSGVREISTLDLYEYSPVLFGAMPLARTASVKEAQLALKALKQLDLKVAEDIDPVDEDEDFDEADLDLFDDDDDDYEEKSGRVLSANSMTLVQNAIDVLQQLLDIAAPSDEEDEMDEEMEDDEEFVGEEDMEEKSYGPDLEVKMATYDSLKSAIESLEGTLDDDLLTELTDLAGAVDEALDGDDADALDTATDAYLDAIEQNLPDADEDTTVALQAAADAIAQLMDSGEDDEPDADEADEDTEQNPEEKSVVIDMDEIKTLRSVLD